MQWFKTKIEFNCCRCGKAVKPGRKLGLSDGKVYCWHCGHNLELASGHRFINKADSLALNHLRSI